MRMCARFCGGPVSFGMGVVSCYPRGAAGGTSSPGGVLWVLGEVQFLFCGDSVLVLAGFCPPMGSYKRCSAAGKRRTISACVFACLAHSEH